MIVLLLKYWREALMLLAIVVLLAMFEYFHHQGFEECKTKADYDKLQTQLTQSQAQVVSMQSQITLANQVAADNQKEADRENDYSIKLEDRLATAKKKHPLPSDCKPDLNRLSYLRAARAGSAGQSGQSATVTH